MIDKRTRFKLDNFFQVYASDNPGAQVSDMVLAASQRFPEVFRANLDNPTVLDTVDEIAGKYSPDDSYLGESD
jgi:hypothetical protein